MTKSVSGSIEPQNVPKVLKSFRSLSDVENFYRFINENSLRREAKMIFELIVSKVKKPKKKTRRKRKKKVIQ